jgi:hypothetical protein
MALTEGTFSIPLFLFIFNLNLYYICRQANVEIDQPNDLSTSTYILELVIHDDVYRFEDNPINFTGSSLKMLIVLTPHSPPIFPLSCLSKLLLYRRYIFVWSFASF